MVSYKIFDVKTFMTSLLRKGTFDEFSLVEAELRTSYTMRLDGRRRKEWYKGEEEESASLSEYMEWKEVRPILYEQIRGKKTPLFIKLVLQWDVKYKDGFVIKTNSSFSPEEVKGLHINICYEKETLHIVTGVSLLHFRLDKQLENAWDEKMKEFIRRQEWDFEET